LQALQVIAGLDPAHGGPSYSVPRLCAELAALGVDVALYSVDGEQGPPVHLGSPAYALRSFPPDWPSTPVLGALRVSSRLDRALAAAAAAADVVHDHGIWLAPNLSAATVARRTGKPFVCSPRGMLSAAALAFSRRKKRLVWMLGQKAALAGAACLHATSEGERAEIRSCGLAAPVAVIPNGVDLPDLDGCAARPIAGPRILLSLGRMHPKKGLDVLLHAWSRVEAAHPDWRLRIVGPAEDGHDRELAGRAEQLGITRASVEGPVYGAARDGLYRGADVFVAPTRSENFGLTVAEALAAGLPAICTRGAPWAELASEDCGWWVDQGAEPLAAALADAMSRPPDVLAAMGERGRALVARRYGWRRVAEEMAGVYAWLAAGAERPACVHLD
jgi:glycosyltransferase involved in cell wall biosynthesis